MNWRRVASLAPLPFIAYLVTVAVAWGIQGRLVYPGAGRADIATPPGVRLATYECSDGSSAHSLEIDQPGAQQTIVYFHGNGEVAGDDLWMARELGKRGFSVVLAEYRGYGASRPGTPSEAGLYDDAEAILKGLARRGVDARHVVLWGASLGSGVAAEMAVRGRGAALVLVTPYTSIVDVAAVHAPWLPVRVILRDHFDTLGKAGSIAIPTFVLHGTADEVIPFEMGERVAAAIGGARFVRVEGGHHNDLFLNHGFRYFGEIAEFLRSRGTGSP